MHAIIDFLPQSGQAVAARISKQWNDIASDKLWKDLRDLIPLLQLLCPLKTVGSPEGMAFVRNPQQMALLRLILTWGPSFLPTICLMQIGGDSRPIHIDATPFAGRME